MTKKHKAPWNQLKQFYGSLLYSFKVLSENLHYDNNTGRFAWLKIHNRFCAMHIINVLWYDIFLYF